ncbi:hypothetical protein BCV70DRAFT_206324 [Testicularia cyperi]|uniref:Uncharacterized protein n=1 Tax=Testicularia cyperi TaxID=1882483 RepID=A0A317XPI8_9BASI|nr:hypothetical protein BCV70DRAFT_206324 [Testicularia cyperi]
MDASLAISEPSTPVPIRRGGTGRRSVLPPFDQALASSPTSVADRIKLLELENLGLVGELDFSESERQRLAHQLASLAQTSTQPPPTTTPALSSSASSSSSSSSSLSSATPMKLPRSSTTAQISTARSEAELKAARRLIQRFAALVSSYDPSSSTLPPAADDDANQSQDAEQSKFFQLDESLFMSPSDPEFGDEVDRSILAPSSLILSTPNGKNKVERGFDWDLLDDIESLRSAWEHFGRKIAFTTAEDRIALHSAQTEAADLRTQLQKLQSSIDQQGPRIDQAGFDQLQARLREQNDELEQARHSLDRQTALNKDLRHSIDEKAETIEQLTRQIEESQNTLPPPPAHTDTAKHDAALKAENDNLIQQVNDLTSQLAQRDNQNQQIASLVDQLAQKRQRLNLIETKRSSLAALQRLVAVQEALASLTKTAADDGLSIHQAWQQHANSISQGLEDLKVQLAAPSAVATQVSASTNTADASTETSTASVDVETMTETLSHDVHSQTEEVSTLPRSTSELGIQTEGSPEVSVSTADQHSPSSNETAALSIQVQELLSQIEELEQRVLRRNTQIGTHQQQISSLQNDLARIRTNQGLAEETVEDLNTENGELKSQIEQLTALVNSLRATSVESVEKADVAIQSDTAHEEEKARHQQEFEQLGAELDVARTRLSEAEEKIEELKQELVGKHDESASLRANNEGLQMQIEELTASVESLQASLDAIKAVEQQREQEQQAHESEELGSARAALRKAEDRISALSLELDSVQLTLAEARESATEDADRVVELQDSMESLRRERDSLLEQVENLQIQLARSTEEQNGLLAAKQTELEAANAAHEQTQSDLEVQLRQVSQVSEQLGVSQLELAGVRAKLSELEQVLEERDALFRERNEEFWTLKEELAELQEAAEHSRDATTTSAAVKTQLQQLEKERAELEDKVAAQESVLLRFKAEMVSARSTEEMLNDQYTASQRRVRELEIRIADLESQPPAPASVSTITVEAGVQASPDSDDSAKTKLLKEQLAKTTEDHTYLKTRVADLEDELTRKADEIEEADSKILDALKESKKFATRYAKILAKYEALQLQQQQQQQQVSVAAVVKTASKPARPAKDPAAAPTPPVSVAGRKRAKPDDEEFESHAHAQQRQHETASASLAGAAASAPGGTVVDTVAVGDANRDRTRDLDLSRDKYGDAVNVKAVYAPSPGRVASGNGFTPVRRALGSSMSSAQSQTARKLASKQAARTPTYPSHISSGTATSSKPSASSTAHAEKVQSQRADALVGAGGMTRSSSNPSALIAARLSPVKPIDDDSESAFPQNQNQNQGHKQTTATPAQLAVTGARKLTDRTNQPTFHASSQAIAKQHQHQSSGLSRLSSSTATATSTLSQDKHHMASFPPTATSASTATGAGAGAVTTGKPSSSSSSSVSSTAHLTSASKAAFRPSSTTSASSNNAPAAAADFLARMKAQRSASAHARV